MPETRLLKMRASKLHVACTREFKNAMRVVAVAAQRCWHKQGIQHVEENLEHLESVVVVLLVGVLIVVWRRRRKGCR